ncbi:TPA: hypothetical protein NJ077_004674 [Vibrio parahaemolyticus]|uniref:hypothetical protein n=1 Tax=Vibrio parahaemolyticus TaxID=670 RepID=UPI0028F6E08F|nr:hypothetical protein [Vibrio parahaemolyticus]HCG6123155.1 hypothetical protein [Vibrio parahaemolyticus]HCG6989578.1 hypothetical protein [Vibrio parahaemolyticus]
MAFPLPLSRSDYGCLFRLCGSVVSPLAGRYVYGAIVNNQFLNQTIKFIEESDLVFIAPSIRPITFSENGNHTLHVSATCRMFESKLNGNPMLSQMIIFTLLDALLDYLYAESEGLSFKRRYLALPDATSKDVVVKEVYRIFKLVRNSMVHSRDSFDISGSTVNISYTHCNTKFELICNLSSLQLMNSIVLALSKNIGVCDKYFEIYLLSYYREMLDGISQFSDDINKPLNSVSPSLDFKHRLRYRVPVNSNSSEDNGGYELPNFSLHESEVWAGIDYIINSNDCRYIVPSEALSNHLTISPQELCVWKVSEANTFAM